MKREDVQRLIELSEKATKGPWRWEKGERLALGRIAGEYTVCQFGGGMAWDEWKGVEPSEEDAEWIAQSRTIMPQLAREWLRMQEALEYLKSESPCTESMCYCPTVDCVKDIVIETLPEDGEER